MNAQTTTLAPCRFCGRTEGGFCPAFASPTYCERERADHRHDLGITISAGELDPETFEAVRLTLVVKLERLVAEINREIGAPKVYFSTTYNGSRECGEH